MHKESNLFKLFRAQSNLTVFYAFSTSVSCLKSHRERCPHSFFMLCSSWIILNL